MLNFLGCLVLFFLYFFRCLPILSPSSTTCPSFPLHPPHSTQCSCCGPHVGKGCPVRKINRYLLSLSIQFVLLLSHCLFCMSCDPVSTLPHPHFVHHLELYTFHTTRSLFIRLSTLIVYMCMHYNFFSNGVWYNSPK